MLALRRNAVSPFKHFFDMNGEMENFFTNAYGESRAESTFSPHIDIFSEKEKLVLKADLPGMTGDQIDISINDNVLMLKGERIVEKSDEQENCVRSERMFGSFLRQFSLPKNVDSEQVEAIFQNGVLEIHMPYSDDVKERKIPIIAS